MGWPWEHDDVMQGRMKLPLAPLAQVTPASAFPLSSGLCMSSSSFISFNILIPIYSHLLSFVFYMCLLLELRGVGPSANFLAPLAVVSRGTHIGPLHFLPYHSALPNRSCPLGLQGMGSEKRKGVGEARQPTRPQRT